MKYTRLAVSEELTLERRREEWREDRKFQGRQSGLLQQKKEHQSKRKRIKVIWSLLRSDNCVGDKETVMMMKGSYIVLHSCRLYIIAEEHIEY